MKKKAVLSFITLLLSFLVGYVSYETAYLAKAWLVEKFVTCKESNNVRCPSSADHTLGPAERR